VRDNGVGLSPDRKLEEGVGLSNTRARLKQLFGDRHRFTLSQGPEGGLAVCLELPFHAQGDETKSAAGAQQGSFG